jgi:spermidine dehydrogenase
MTKKPFWNINRRDFLGGAALTGAAGALISPMELFAQTGNFPNDYYPPSNTGLRGSHAGSFEVAHSVSWEGKNWGRPKDQTDNVYDMVVVGGGISGLSAAFLYQQKNGSGKKVLILDNHDDFGGHAKRNEFDVDGKTLLGFGGSQTIDGPKHYSPEAKKLLKDISIETERFYDYFDIDYYSNHNMKSGIFFDGAFFNKSVLIENPFGIEPNAQNRQKIENIINSFPVSKESQEALIKTVFEPKDHFPDLNDEEKINKLSSLNYVEYLQDYYGVPKEATDIFRDEPKAGLFGVGWDAMSAYLSIEFGMPGTAAYAQLSTPHRGYEDDEPYIFHFPDGNAGIARSLVRKLIPDAVPGNTMEDLVLSKVQYDLLDQANSTNRIRLNSTAVDVRHTSNQTAVDVTYVRNNQTYRVRGKHVIMACYNSILPFICPDIPESQKEALTYSTKVPLVFSNVAIRNWRAIADTGINRANVPLSDMHQGYYLDFPVSMGGYDFSKTPDDPIVLCSYYVPSEPDQGLTAREQNLLGRHKLYQHTFEDMEGPMIRQMDEMYGKQGFDVERDIAGITINRWPHGYAYEYNHYFDPHDYTYDNGPHVTGRAQLGRISIANSDSSAYAYVDGAIDAAVRAVNEQIKI